MDDYVTYAYGWIDNSTRMDNQREVTNLNVMKIFNSLTCYLSPTSKTIYILFKDTPDQKNNYVSIVNESNCKGNIYRYVKIVNELFDLTTYTKDGTIQMPPIKSKN